MTKLPNVPAEIPAALAVRPFKPVQNSELNLCRPNFEAAKWQLEFTERQELAVEVQKMHLNLRAPAFLQNFGQSNQYLLAAQK